MDGNVEVVYIPDKFKLCRRAEPIDSFGNGGLGMTGSVSHSEVGPQFTSREVIGTIWPKAEVASLPAERLSEMSEGELVEVIRSVHQPHRGSDLRGPLAGLSREPLVQLARQARRYCRTQGY